MWKNKDHINLESLTVGLKNTLLKAGFKNLYEVATFLNANPKVKNDNSRDHYLACKELENVIPNYYWRKTLVNEILYNDLTIDSKGENKMKKYIIFSPKGNGISHYVEKSNLKEITGETTESISEAAIFNSLYEAEKIAKEFGEKYIIEEYKTHTNDAIRALDAIKKFKDSRVKDGSSFLDIVKNNVTEKELNIIEGKDESFLTISEESQNKIAKALSNSWENLKNSLSSEYHKAKKEVARVYVKSLIDDKFAEDYGLDQESFGGENALKELLTSENEFKEYMDYNMVDGYSESFDGDAGTEFEILRDMKATSFNSPYHLGLNTGLLFEEIQKQLKEKGLI